MERLLYFSLIISLTGILTLFVISPFQIREITTNSNLSINEQVKISGKIISERIADKSSSFTILTLQDDKGKIEVTCNCQNSWLNRTVQVTGKVEEYDKKLQITADKIENVA